MFIFFRIPKAFQAHNRVSSNELEPTVSPCCTFIFLVSYHRASIFWLWQNIQCQLISSDKGNISIALLFCQKDTGENERSVCTNATLWKKKKSQAVCRCILNVNECLLFYFVSRLPYNHCCYTNWQLQNTEKPFLALVMQVFMWVCIKEKGCFASAQIFSKSKKGTSLKVKKQRSHIPDMFYAVLNSLQLASANCKWRQSRIWGTFHICMMLYASTLGFRQD